MDGFATEVIARLPLAKAMYCVLAHVLQEPVLEGLYDLHRGRGYQREISFSDFVWLIHGSLFVQPSAHQAIEKAIAAGDLKVQACSIYQKLGRMNTSLSMALLRQCTVLLDALLPSSAREPALPTSLTQLDPVIIDGKTIKHVAHRLKATRPYSGAATGGKFLAALSMRGELVRAIEATPDSPTNDVPLLASLLAQLRWQVSQNADGRPTRPILFIADRQFGGVKVPLQLCQGGNHFLIRFQNNVGFEPDPHRPASKGIDERGRPYVQQWGWIGKGLKGLKGFKLYSRRIELQLISSQKLIIQTDLVDEKEYPAVDLLKAYQERQTIERVFQQITEVCELRHLIGSSPQGTIFQTAFCMLMYNVLQVIKSHVAEGAKLAPRQVSSELLFDDITAEMTTWNRLVSPQMTVQAITPAITPLASADLRDRLGTTLRPLWTPRWRKSPPKKPRPATKKRHPPGGTICVHRILQAAQPRRPPPGQRNSRSTT